jgi:hypothetical protein
MPRHLPGRTLSANPADSQPAAADRDPSSQSRMRPPIFSGTPKRCLIILGLRSSVAKIVIQRAAKHVAFTRAERCTQECVRHGHPAILKK